MVVVIAAIFVILIPILRERDRKRSQALANAEPWEVFEFRAEPAKETFAQGEEIIVHCEIVNLTAYPLTLSEELKYFSLFIGDTNGFVGPAYSRAPISTTAIPPAKSLSFDVTLYPMGIGTSKVTIEVGIEGSAYGSLTRFAMMSEEERPITSDLIIIPSGHKRFRSQAFQLNIEKSESSQKPTFDEIAASLKPLWRHFQAFTRERTVYIPVGS